LTNVQAVATCAVRIECTAASAIGINTSEERELESNVQVILTGLTTNTQSCRQQAGRDSVSAVIGRCAIDVGLEVAVEGSVGVVGVDSTALKY